MQYAHYRGGGPMMADLITGRVDFALSSYTAAKANFESGKLRGLAIDAPGRFKQMPDVPTLTEAGFGKEKVASWFAVAAPAGTPPAIVARLNEGFVKASQDPDLKRRLEENGTPIVTNTPAQMGQAMEQEWQTMQQLAKTLNLRIQ
jgi:tripartite-type tricarboxylate transporter receptor subunit TctC